MTATLWLLAALIACLAAALVLLTRYFSNRWDEAEKALEYRTADWSAIDADTKRIQRSVPNPIPQPEPIIRGPFPWADRLKRTPPPYAIAPADLHRVMAFPPPVRVGGCSVGKTTSIDIPSREFDEAVSNVIELRQQQLALVLQQGRAAAQADRANGTKTPNPYRRMGARRVTWFAGYESELLETKEPDHA